MFLKQFDTTSSAFPRSEATDRDGDHTLDDGSDEDDVVVPIPSIRTQHPSTLPWVEKYRPRSLSDVAHQDEVVATLRKSMQTANVGPTGSQPSASALPHLLLYGPPGTGKTSTILAVARELYGPELVKKRVLELNASDERGIDIIRNKVKEFAQIAVGSRDAAPGYPCPPYKIIILDEADSMTKDAQSALRRTMEQYTRVTRFCLICNYVSRIIDPIKSRCAKFRYRPLAHAAMKQRLRHIAQLEHIAVDEQGGGDGESGEEGPAEAAGASDPLELLCRLSGGDMRQAITLMQSAARLLTPSPAAALLAPSAARTLTCAHVLDVCGLTPPAFITRLHAALKSNSFDAVQQTVQDMVSEGFDSQSVLHAWLATLMADGSISEDRKAAICMHMAEIEKRLVDGSDEYLQMLDLVATARKHIHKPNGV